MEREEHGQDRMVHIRQSELDNLLEQAAERGADRSTTNLLQRLGLEDETAAKDLGELRRLAVSLRQAKTTVTQTVVRAAVMGLLVTLAVALGIKTKVLG